LPRRDPLDYYATPPELVEVMLDAAGPGPFGSLLDPAAGDGRLLRAARDRWSEAAVCAIDIDPSRARQIARGNPSWEVRQADFLGGGQEATERSEGPTRSNLVLLNPPFSGRGGSTTTVGSGSDRVQCSRAMAFLLQATRSVGELGVVVAVLPAGALTNQRDRLGHAALAQTGSLDVVTTNPSRAFKGAVTRTVIVRWERKAERSPWSHVVPDRSRPAEVPSARITRGALPVHIAKDRFDLSPAGTLPFIHTTSIAPTGQITPLGRMRPRSRERIVAEPSVLLPRVGRPAHRKLSIYMGEPAVISDCLYALTPPPTTTPAQLREAVRRVWPRLEASYGGSCAPFLRMDDLQRVLATIELETTFDASPRTERESLVARERNFGLVARERPRRERRLRTAAFAPPAVVGGARPAASNENEQLVRGSRVAPPLREDPQLATRSGSGQR